MRKLFADCRMLAIACGERDNYTDNQLCNAESALELKQKPFAPRRKKAVTLAVHHKI